MSNEINDLRNPSNFLPLAPQDFQVLLLVAETPLHGYGIVKASRESNGGKGLELGSLYRIVARLTKQGLIEDVSASEQKSKRDRRYYRATNLGRRVARAEAVRLKTLLTTDTAMLLLGD